MKVSPYTRRFLNSTRGRIIELLRENARTVTELAEALSLTDNAVRAHLATLERDGLVQQVGERPGSRKPHLCYELTPSADEIFPKAYGPVLNALLEVLGDRLGAEQVDELLRQVGRDLAPPNQEKRSLEDRLRDALQAIESIGGKARIEREDGKITICGAGCPLATVTSEHAQVCDMLEELLGAITGAQVRQRCRREPVPQCRFEVTEA